MFLCVPALQAILEIPFSSVEKFFSNVSKHEVNVIEIARNINAIFMEVSIMNSLIYLIFFIFIIPLQQLR